MVWGSCHFLINSASFNVLHEPPWYGTVCPVVWEDGGRESPSYPILLGRRRPARAKTAAAWPAGEIGGR
jgi:hypothetical protein